MYLPLPEISHTCSLCTRTLQKRTQARCVNRAFGLSKTSQLRLLLLASRLPSNRTHSSSQAQGFAKPSRRPKSKSSRFRQGTQVLAAEGSSLTGHWIGSDSMASPAPADREELEADDARHVKRPRLDAPPAQEQIVKGSGLANRALRSVLKGNSQRCRLPF